jgi:hypothetical protein
LVMVQEIFAGGKAEADGELALGDFVGGES